MRLTGPTDCLATASWSWYHEMVCALCHQHTRFYCRISPDYAQANLTKLLILSFSLALFIKRKSKKENLNLHDKSSLCLPFFAIWECTVTPNYPSRCAHKTPVFAGSLLTFETWSNGIKQMKIMHLHSCSSLRHFCCSEGHYVSN